MSNNIFTHNYIQFFMWLFPSGSNLIYCFSWAIHLNFGEWNVFLIIVSMYELMNNVFPLFVVVIVLWGQWGGDWFSTLINKSCFHWVHWTTECLLNNPPPSGIPAYITTLLTDSKWGKLSHMQTLSIAHPFRHSCTVLFMIHEMILNSIQK